MNKQEVKPKFIVGAMPLLLVSYVITSSIAGCGCQHFSSEDYEQVVKVTVPAVIALGTAYVELENKKDKNEAELELARQKWQSVKPVSDIVTSQNEQTISKIENEMQAIIDETIEQGLAETEEQAITVLKKSAE